MTSRSDTSPWPRAPGTKQEAAGFSRLLAVETVPESGLDIEIRASEAELAALAAQCGLVSLKSFKASFHVTKQGRGRYSAAGALSALVTQLCVVTLEPFETEVAAAICVDFAPSGALPPAASTAGADPPDPIINGQIDLGALAAEFLVLNLDLYPRKPGAVFEKAETGGGESEKDSPFAVLLRR